MRFREDINALRALAVIAVVIFHFNREWLPGGFAGVDVFFVISGFLMTMIIMKGIQKEEFSVVRFYHARVRRIIPALAFLCFSLLVLGWFLLSPIDYLILGKHAAASLTFTSNIVYWTESNYFNASSIEKWLLHTWSLSVEWQFYLIYPVILVLLKKFLTIAQIKVVLVVGTVLAFSFSIFVTFKSSSAAYFLLPTRAWQMLAGGLVFLYPLVLGRSTKYLLQLIGMAAIFSSFFFFSKYTPWPGYSSLLPILGTCLVLCANNSESRLVNNKVTHAIGKWSYSIYLWHWPVVVAGFYFSLGENWWIIGIPLSVILGALSFRLIESKELKDFRLSKLSMILRPLQFAFILSVVSVSIFATDGFIKRFPDDTRALFTMAMEAEDELSYPGDNVNIGNSTLMKIEGQSDKNILVLGASHAQQFYPYVVSLKNKYNVYFLTTVGCFVTPSMQNPKWSCDNLKSYKSLLSQIKFDKVLTSFYSFDSYLPEEEHEKQRQISIRVKEYDQFLKNIKAEVEHVYIVLGEPKGDEFDPKSSMRKGLRDFITEGEARSRYIVHNRALSNLTELDNVSIVDPINYLCEGGICKTRNLERGFFYRDKNHMRPWYAIEKMTYLDDIFVDKKRINQ